MILRAISRRLISLKSLKSQAVSIIFKPKYNFYRKIQKASTKYASFIQTQIKTEEGNLTDVSGQQQQFKNQGWSIARVNTLVELTKNIGKYRIRLLSNIKSPSKFDQAEQGKDPNEQQQQHPYEGDMNEVTVCITKSGSDKTMVVNTVVTESFEITNITFAENYQSAKQHRLDMFNTNNYTGPELETISDELLDGIYGFLEQECKVDNALLGAFADYCVDSEQQFYINWLKDLKNML